MDRSPIANIEDSVINFTDIVENQKKDFFAELTSINETKTVIFESVVYESFTLFVNMASLMSTYNIDHIYDVNSTIDEVSENVLFFIRPDIVVTKKVCDLVQQFTSSNKNIHCYIYYLPRKTFICSQIIKTEGIHQAEIRELKIDLFFLDKDLISMMLEDNFEKLYVQNNPMELEYISYALLKLQSFYGAFPVISSFGGKSDAVLKLISRLKNTIVSGPDDTSEIAQCILFDRSVDNISPLLTAHTLLSLIDDEYHIVGNHAPIPKAVLKRPAVEGEDPNVKFFFNNTDMAFKIFADMNINVCNKNISKVTNEFIKQRDMIMQKNHEKNQDMKTLESFIPILKEINKAQKFLPDYSSIIDHFTPIITSYAFRQNYDIERSCVEGNNIYDYIMDHIILQDPIENMLRLLSLYSLVNNGIKAKQYDAIKREIINTYGFKYLLSIHKLEQLGFIKVRESNSVWSNLSNKLKLVNSDVDLDTQDDMSYVTSYIAPLSCRLLQTAVQNPALLQGDLQKYLPYPYTETKQSGASYASNNKKKVVLVCFIGGITYAEIAALRQYSKSPSSPVEFIILTTQIINGKNIIHDVATKF